MAEKYVKEVKTKSGKTKYRAEVWYRGRFYTSKTFDNRAIAVKFKEVQYTEAVAGRLLPATERREKRVAQSDLLRPMSHWAQLYVEEYADEHGKSRLNEYKLVGELTANRSLKDFHGREGARLMKSLQNQWLKEPRLSCCPYRGKDSPKARPLSKSTVRLRMSALSRIIRFAHSKLPEDSGFVPPALHLEFEFELPPAHENPRTVEPSDEEYGKLLRHFGQDSDFGEFLQVIDETGCRLGEVLGAQGAHIDVFRSGDTVVGGCLTLHKHKTAHRTKKPRFIPLSVTAATILEHRKELHGSGKLFAGLGRTDKVCKAFDEARAVLEIPDLVIKDFRRAFINRNKGCVSQLDMLKIVGESSLLTARKVSASDAAVQDAVGHTSLKTTAGYSVPDMQHLSTIFTRTSRRRRVCDGASAVELANEDAEVQALKLRLSDTLAALQQLGAIAPLQEDPSSGDVAAALLKRISLGTAIPSPTRAVQLAGCTREAPTEEVGQGPEQPKPLLRVFKSRRR